MYFRELTLEDYDILMQNIRNAFPHNRPIEEEGLIMSDRADKKRDREYLWLI